MLSASKAVFRCPCIALLDMAGWLSHPLGTNPRSHFFFLRACGSKHTTHNSTSFSCWPGQMCCAVAAVRPAKGFSPWTHFLRAIPCDAPTHLSFCNRYVKDATYACEDPISSAARAACRNLRSHHTFHHKNGRKQAVSPSSSNELRHMH